VDPRTGRLTPTADNGLSGNNQPSCEGDRLLLADLNDQLAFTRLTQLANRANVTFYAIDPRGLPAFDTPIDQQRTGQPAPGQGILPPPSQDSAMLVRRQGTLRDLANTTDGIALLNTNALEAVFRRIEADMSSYYLLGYHSTGKLDGRFHKIEVRVARPRVQVRARPGFLAVPPPAAVPASNVARPAGATLAADALKELAVIGRTPAVHLRGAIIGGALWIDAELPMRPFAAGTEIQLQVLDSKGEALGVSRRQLAAGARSFRQMIPFSAATGTLSVRARVVSTAGAAVLETLDLDAAAASKTALTTRRTGAGAAAIDSPAADLRFRRSEQIRVELPATGAPFTAQLLDRTGRELPIQLTVEERGDADGRRWASAGLPLAPLAQGDYVVQMAETGSIPVAVAFRVVP